MCFSVLCLESHCTWHFNRFKSLKGYQMLFLADIYFPKVRAVFMLPYCCILTNSPVKTSETRKEIMTLVSMLYQGANSPAAPSCQNTDALLCDEWSAKGRHHVHTGLIIAMTTRDASMALRSCQVERVYYLRLWNQVTWALDPGSNTQSSVTWISGLTSLSLKFFHAKEFQCLPIELFWKLNEKICAQNKHSKCLLLCVK